MHWKPAALHLSGCFLCAAAALPCAAFDVLSRPALTLAPRAPLTAGLSRAHPVASIDDRAIDAALTRFASANAGNPAVQAALESAAASIKRNPDSYLGAGGTTNTQALSTLVVQAFSGAGQVAALDAATGGSDRNALGSGLASDDIEALATIVMMEAARSSREDLKAQMEAVKSMNARKQALRDASAAVNAMAASCNEQGDCVARPLPGGVLQLPASGTVAKKDLDEAKDTVKDKLDSMSEMGETESLRLQMAMDRLSKMMSALSNLLKKTSDTQAGIIGNLK